MDCAGARGLRFPALPVKPEPETVFLMRDPLMAILPEDHPLQDLEAFLSMVESRLGVSVLPQLILRRIPYRAASLIVPRFARFFLAYRDIVPALRSKKSVPLALKRFFDDLPFRFPAARLKGKPFISPVRSSFS